MKTATATWPTNAEFEAVLEKFTDAHNALDGLVVSLYPMREAYDEDPQPESVTLQTLGMLSQLNERCRCDIDQITSWLDEMEDLRRRAAFNVGGTDA